MSSNINFDKNNKYSYIAINKSFLKNKSNNLSKSSQLVLLKLLAFSDYKLSRLRMFTHTICDQIDITPRTLQRAKKELKNKGYIDTIRHGNKASEIYFTEKLKYLISPFFNKDDATKKQDKENYYTKKEMHDATKCPNTKDQNVASSKEIYALKSSVELTLDDFDVEKSNNTLYNNTSNVPNINNESNINKNISSSTYKSNLLKDNKNTTTLFDDIDEEILEINSILDIKVNTSTDIFDTEENIQVKEDLTMQQDSPKSEIKEQEKENNKELDNLQDNNTNNILSNDKNTIKFERLNSLEGEYVSKEVERDYLDNTIKENLTAYEEIATITDESMRLLNSLLKENFKMILIRKYADKAQRINKGVELYKYFMDHERTLNKYTTDEQKARCLYNFIDKLDEKLDMIERMNYYKENQRIQQKIKENDIKYAKMVGKEMTEEEKIENQKFRKSLLDYDTLLGEFNKYKLLIFVYDNLIDDEQRKELDSIDEKFKYFTLESIIKDNLREIGLDKFREKLIKK